MQSQGRVYLTSFPSPQHTNLLLCFSVELVDLIIKVELKLLHLEVGSQRWFGEGIIMSKKRNLILVARLIEVIADEII